ncbi:uncharacterized protein LOC126655376 [Mercurialis annua]|uniref:uncharacterized protein LOC126655376 n=1 Tax=Mercurialis annua TaxID=3986 RepID=UPI00215FA78E|nr:uncharacterized protein LOC126655376 [Mercurialis annua]XP_050205507.1 uncharacterized protein LOC126655376 [Mercurialis annua]XP_050205516.1 uncharacterized protein LOC126655376 [Mercurialis annua]
MTKFMSCFKLPVEKKEKKADNESPRSVDVNKGRKSLKIRLEQPVKPFESDELKTTSFSVSVESGSPSVQSDSIGAKVMSQESFVGDEAPEIAYEGEDEQEETASIKRELSNCDLQANTPSSCEQCVSDSLNSGFSNSFDINDIDQLGGKAENGNEINIDEIQSGHVSDPGMGKAALWGSPKLKRSCSNLETNKHLREKADQLTPSKSEYSGKSLELDEELRNPGSPSSVTSHRSADRVMLKKHSSSQVLPSRSRRLWWKLFLWSHRNLHRPRIEKPKPQVVTATNQQCGYNSDTVEPNRALTSSNMLSAESFTAESLSKCCNNNEDDNQSWDGFHGEVSGQWPQKQWVAFSMETSPFTRVDEWVKDLETQVPPSNDASNSGEGNVLSTAEAGRSPPRGMANSTRRPDIILSEEIVQANAVIQSLNGSSTVAHISGIGLKAIPTISCFVSLRSVNLSNNFIVYINPGSLPKGLHTLNLSRNKINAIEGLRELTRLRVLDLSHNRISRIGQGLSNCTMIKELYLAGNKISDVEGLHRLLKLTVLDVSFNKITTTKALGQLVANYNSLKALNLLGNPIQSNISDDQLRKALCGLLPKLVYLNKQPIKPQRAREVLTDSVAKAALGTSSGLSSRRRVVKRASIGGSTSFNAHRNSVVAKPKSKIRSKGQTHQVRTGSSTRAS